MRNIISMALVAMFFFYSCNQTTKTNKETKDSVATTVSINERDSSNSIDQVVRSFATAYANKSNTGVNALIHPDLGLKIIYRPGAADTYLRVDSIDFAKPIPNYFPYPTIINNFSKLNYETIPVFDCGLEKWNKTGMFCDTITHPNQLSTIIDFERDYEPKKYSNALIKEIKAQEKDSYRVVITTEIPLVFHLTKYQGAWYVTVLDRAYASCEA